MLKRLILTSLICLPAMLVASNPVDSLSQALSQYRRSGNTEKQVEINLALGKHLNKDGQHQEALANLLVALRLMPDNANAVEQFELYSQLGLAYYWLDQYAVALDYCTKANYLAESHLGLKEQASSLTQLSDVHVNLGNFEESLRFQLESLQKSELLNDSICIGDAHRVLSRIYWYKSEFDEALESAEKALSFYGSKGDIKSIYTCLAGIASIYAETGQIPMALEYAKRSLELAIKENYQYGVAFSTGMLGEVSRQSGEIAAAKMYLSDAIQKFHSLDIKHEAADFTNTLAETLIIDGQLEAARDSFLSALVIAEEIKSLLLKRDVYHKLSNVYQLQEDYSHAFQYAQLHAALKDSLMNEDVEKKMDQLHLDHEIQKRERQIALMREEQKSDITNILIGVLIFLLFVAGFILFQYFQRIKTQKKLDILLKDQKREIETKEQRIQDVMEDIRYFSEIVSHDLKATVSEIRGNIDAIKKEANGNESDINKLGHHIDYLDKILNSLLLYSIADNKDESKEQLDLGEMVREVIQALPAAYRGKGARINIHNLPTIYAEKRKIFQLFQHLIINGIKNHSPELIPEIHVSCSKVTCPYTGEPEYMISIKDKGKGISKDKQKELFHLHYGTENPYESGTGIGLVICRKIVEHYNGAIWVDSNEGLGSTFHFVLPFSQILEGQQPRLRETETVKA